MSDTSEFIKYFESLPKVGSLCRLFERNEDYYVYGNNATLTFKGLKVGVERKLESGAGSLNFVKIPNNSLADTLRFLLFQRHCSVEILRKVGSTKSQEWIVVNKGSPGNIIAFEEILFSENSYCMQRKGIIAIKMSPASIDKLVGFAYCDPVLREFQVCEFQDTADFSILQSVLVQLSPQECLLLSSAVSRQTESIRGTLRNIVETHKIAITQCKSEFFEPLSVTDAVRLIVPSDKIEYNFDEWQSSNKGCSLAAVIRYLELCAEENNFGQFKIIEFNTQLYARIDKASVFGLDLFLEKDSVTMDVNEKDYLFGFLNSCRSPAGERLLLQWIKQPLVDRTKIEERLDLVQIFVEDRSFLLEIQHFLEKFVDIELLARKIQRRSVNIQGFYKIHQLLTKIPQLVECLSDFDGDNKAVLEQLIIAPLKESSEEMQPMYTMIDETIDFTAIQNKEYVIKPTYDHRLQEKREEMQKLKKKMEADLEKTKDDIGVQTVKLELYERHGYTFRITLKDENHLRNKKNYIVLNTGNSGVRFQSPALQKTNELYANFQKEYEEIQKSIVEEMMKVSAPYTPVLKELSSVLAWLDVTIALAHKAANACNTYVRPVISDKCFFYLSLKDMRHPVLEEKLSDFIPNSVELNSEGKNFYFITGPNMGGKSTYIRSVAVCALLAQIGSFVPCSSAEVSLTDAIYTRIGASDNPGAGVSTFMHEMLEMQRMLKNATSQSLLIIDELGRGTSTSDGYGISHAISCEIARRINAPCLFATHFHELTSLSDSIPNIGNLHVEALQTENDLTFLYKVKPGICKKSFGIHVAQMAGFPPSVIKNAQKKLGELENSIMTYEELVRLFRNAPFGKRVLDALRHIIPSRFDMEREPVLEEDKNEDNMAWNIKCSPDMSRNSEIQRAQSVLNLLEEMEKATFT